jgi:hypothetical protein
LESEAYALHKESEKMGDYAITFLLACALVGAAFYYFVDW